MAVWRNSTTTKEHAGEMLAHPPEARRTFISESLLSAGPPKAIHTYIHPKTTRNTKDGTFYAEEAEEAAGVDVFYVRTYIFM